MNPFPLRIRLVYGSAESFRNGCLQRTILRLLPCTFINQSQNLNQARSSLVSNLCTICFFVCCCCCCFVFCLCFPLVKIIQTKCKANANPDQKCRSPIFLIGWAPFLASSDNICWKQLNEGRPTPLMLRVSLPFPGLKQVPVSQTVKAIRLSTGNHNFLWNYPFEAKSNSSAIKATQRNISCSFWVTKVYPFPLLLTPPRLWQRLSNGVYYLFVVVVIV